MKRNDLLKMNLQFFAEPAPEPAPEPEPNPAPEPAPSPEPEPQLSAEEQIQALMLENAKLKKAQAMEFVHHQQIRIIGMVLEAMVQETIIE